MKVISVANQKGGVGKTTMTYNIGYRFADKGFKVLMIDTDPQGNLTQLFDYNNTFIDDMVLFDEELQYFTVTDKIDFAGSSINLAKAGNFTGLSAYSKLKKALKKAPKTWDYVLIDCAPTLTFFDTLAFIASDYILIPSDLGTWSAEGCLTLVNKIVRELQEDGYNTELEILGIALNKLENTRINRQNEKKFVETFNGLVFDTRLKALTDFQKAVESRKPVWEYEPKGQAAKSTLKLIDEIEERLHEQGNK